ncbi:toprim domain-containing protein, partial [Acinetobacter baumannii]
FDDPFAQFEQPFSFDEPVQEGNLYDLLENVAQFYEHQLPTSQKAKNYFKQRGLSDQTIQFWRLGYAPEDWQHLEKAFPYDIEGLKQLGLIRSSDSGRDFDLLRDRVIFPIRDPKGRVVGFGGRALNDEIKPKYINSPDSEVFHKNQLLYGLYEGRKLKANDWLMVEGYMDVIALQQYGITGAVATLGTASNTEHLNILFKQNNRITIAFDGDAAGQKAARRTLEIALPLLNDGRELKFFVLPNDHDPDSLIRREGVENFQKLLQQAPLLSDFVFAHLTGQHDISTPEGKSLVMGELRELTELLPKQGSFRYLLTQSFREKLGLGKRFTPQISHDASLSFNIQTKDEDFAIAILMHHPFLYIHFEGLRAYIPQDELLAKILAILNRIFDELPDDQELATYYVLGACSSYCHEIADIMQRTNIQALTQAPEVADKLAKEYALGLQERYLRQKLKSKISLVESRNLRQQLNELTKQISLRLLS